MGMLSMGEGNGPLSLGTREVILSLQYVCYVYKAVSFRVVKYPPPPLYLSNQGFIICRESSHAWSHLSWVEAAIHTSVIRTKIPCDFTQQQLLRGVRSSAAQVAGKVERREGALELSLAFSKEELQLLWVSGEEDEQSLGNCQMENSRGFLNYSFGASL